ncbi:MAG: hypothetical protein ACW99F_13575 [Candidatus Hodarchaeales archaeon]|jgi:glycyl-tRNA synthetase beta subunit
MNKDSNVEDSKREESTIKKQIAESKQQESPFTYGSQQQLDSRLLEIMKEIKKEFPDSNLKIQSELASEDEIHYFFSHCEIHLQDSSQLEMSEFISHLITHIVYLIDTYDSHFDDFHVNFEIRQNRSQLHGKLEELMHICEYIKTDITRCEF